MSLAFLFSRTEDSEANSIHSRTVGFADTIVLWPATLKSLNFNGQ